MLVLFPTDSVPSPLSLLSIELFCTSYPKISLLLATCSAMAITFAGLFVGFGVEVGAGSCFIMRIMLFSELGD